MIKNNLFIIQLTCTPVTQNLTYLPLYRVKLNNPKKLKKESP
jgi:hypothetical protein